MKHTITRRQFLQASGLMAAAGLMVGCGGDDNTNGGDAEGKTSYNILYDTQPATQNYLTTATDIEMYTGANCVDTLVEFDNKGVLREGLATKWEWDAESLTWTFTLREEDWVDRNGEVIAPVTAQDFVDSMKYVLDPANAASNTYLITGYIAGAEEYFNYWTYRASAEAGGAAATTEDRSYRMDGDKVVVTNTADGTTEVLDYVDFDTVGVKALDEHTLQYTLTYDFPGFLSLLVYLPYEPAYGPLLEQTGDQYATNADTLYSCGAYYLSEYQSLESWVMTKNPVNYDADHVYIDEIHRTYVAEAATVGPEMVKRGEIDEATISGDILDDWLNNDETKDLVSMDRPNTNYTYFYLFNFMPVAHSFSSSEVEGVDAQYEPDNWLKAINNTNFRKAFLYGINNDQALAVQAPKGFEGYRLHTVTPPSFCANKDGVDYTKCGKLAELDTFFNEEKAKECRDLAREELTKVGCTFPIKVQMPYNPSTPNWDKMCQVLKQQLEGLLGTDFINIIITEGPTDGFLSSVRRAGKYEFLRCNWGADYSDPETETDPFYQEEGSRGGRYCYLRTAVERGLVNGETADAIMSYMTQVEAAKQITDDINARYEAFANAEATLIENALCIPSGMSIPPYIVTKLNYWDGQYASTGFSNKRMKGIHMMDHYVSMAEAEANRDAR